MEINEELRSIIPASLREEIGRLFPIKARSPWWLRTLEDWAQAVAEADPQAAPIGAHHG
jgi:hypothetical protein